MTITNGSVVRIHNKVVVNEKITGVVITNIVQPFETKDGTLRRDIPLGTDYYLVWTDDGEMGMYHRDEIDAG